MEIFNRLHVMLLLTYILVSHGDLMDAIVNRELSVCFPMIKKK